MRESYARERVRVCVCVFREKGQRNGPDRERDGQEKSASTRSGPLKDQRRGGKQAESTSLGFWSPFFEPNYFNLVWRERERNPSPEQRSSSAGSSCSDRYTQTTARVISFF